MKKIIYATACFLTLFSLFSGRAMALENRSPLDGTKITLTYNKTTAVADGSDTINFWYGAYYTVKTPLSIDCSDGATIENPLPAAIDTVDGQLCRAATFSNRMTLVISGTGNNVSPSPLGEHGGILPDYNLISGTGEFTLKSSSPGEKTITYSANSLLPGGPVLTLSTTVNFIPNTAGSSNNTNSQSSTITNSNNQTSNQVSSTNNNSTTQGSESTTTTASPTISNNTVSTSNDQTSQTNSNSSTSDDNLPSGVSYTTYYIVGAALILLIGLILFWQLYIRRNTENGSVRSQKALGFGAIILIVVFMAASGWLFMQNKNLKNDKGKLETDLANSKSDLENNKAASDKKKTDVANKVEVMSLIFGPYSHEKNNFTKAGDLIKAMNNETLNSDWAALQANKGQVAGEKLMSDLINTTITDLK